MDEKETNTNKEPVRETEDITLNINADDNIAGINRLDDPLDMETELESLQKELEEQKDKYLRLYAEFDNFRRRSARERVDLIQTAGKEVIQSLLEVLDDCERAEKQLQQSEGNTQLKEGIALVFGKLRQILHGRGLKEMNSVGMVFNPDLHEAITEIPVSDSKLKGKIMDELEKGYLLNDKIIRYAKVVVGK